MSAHQELEAYDEMRSDEVMTYMKVELQAQRQWMEAQMQAERDRMEGLLRQMQARHDAERCALIKSHRQLTISFTVIVVALIAAFALQW